MGSLTDIIELTITENTGQPFRCASSRGLGGGCIHDAREVTGEDGRQFFIKENQSDLYHSFKAEAKALRVISQTRTIRVPNPIGAVTANDKSALILEFLPLGSGPSRNWHQLGESIARMHQSTTEFFGWSQDNWIGTSPQQNGQSANWVHFYAKCRLNPQIEWAREKGLGLPLADALLQALPRFFEDYQPQPSLLHGDLWSGNAAFLDDGTPVVFDPAAYYGDREADLALTELFGGYPGDFYRGYQEVWPLDAGYATRKSLYNLYHVLNHFNIFGGGYGSQADNMIASLLRAT